jgi:hypothetical protein
MEIRIGERRLFGLRIVREGKGSNVVVGQLSITCRRHDHGGGVGKVAAIVVGHTAVAMVTLRAGLEARQNRDAEESEVELSRASKPGKVISMLHWRVYLEEYTCMNCIEVTKGKI